jgi:hypothetical protein
MAKSLKLLLNIGDRDAPALGLTRTKEGDVVSVDDKTATILLERGWATDPGSDEPAPQAKPTSSTTPPVKDIVAAQSSQAAHSAASAPAEDFDGMTKEDLKAYADDYGIAGVTMAMTKDDMVKAVKKAVK